MRHSVSANSADVRRAYADARVLVGPLAGDFSVLSLRTNKADVVVGVPQEVADRLDASGEKWRVNGKYVGCAISRVVVRSAHRSFCLTDTPSYRFCLEAHR